VPIFSALEANGLATVVADDFLLFGRFDSDYVVTISVCAPANIGVFLKKRLSPELLVFENVALHVSSENFIQLLIINLTATLVFKANQVLLLAHDVHLQVLLAACLTETMPAAQLNRLLVGCRYLYAFRSDHICVADLTVGLLSHRLGCALRTFLLVQVHQVNTHLLGKLLNALGSLESAEL
jgi:hypothetical protein